MIKFKEFKDNDLVDDLNKFVEKNNMKVINVMYRKVYNERDSAPKTFSETGEKMFVYLLTTNVDDLEPCICPLEMFMSEVNHEKYDVKRMKLINFLEIVDDHAELSFFNTDSSEYVLHRVKKNEVIKKYPELLGREIDYVNVHWFDDTSATLGIVLMC